jgi:hypothetical protein
VFHLVTADYQSCPAPLGIAEKPLLKVGSGTLNANDITSGISNFCSQ